VTLADVNAAHQDASRDETQKVRDETQGQRENVVSFRQLLTPGEKFQFVRQLKADLEHLPPICLAIGDTITDKQINFPDHPLFGFTALGNEAIAADCHCTKRTVIRGLQAMKKRGHIGIKRRFDDTSLIWPILKSEVTKLSPPRGQKRHLRRGQKCHSESTYKNPLNEPTKNLLPGDFEDWWNAYPRKIDKAKAVKAFQQALKVTTAAILLEGAQRYAAGRYGQDPTYTKYPASWLNGKCWQNEPEPRRQASTSLARAAAGGIRYLESGASTDDE
jgi:hypothetical protein